MKFKRRIFTFLTLFLSFFIFMDGLDAAVTIKGYFPSPSSFGNETYNRDGKTKYIKGTGIFTVDGKHAYCVEPNEKMTSTGYENKNNSNTKNEFIKYDNLSADQ